LRSPVCTTQHVLSIATKVGLAGTSDCQRAAIRISLLWIMDTLRRVVFVRSGCALLLATMGGLAGLVAWAMQTAQSDYPRSPSSIVWAAVGATFGFILGACVGIRRLSGRSAWLVSGLVAGMLAGVFIGCEWAYVEYSFTRLALLRDGVPADFIDAAQGGISVRAYATIGLQYGICLGVLAGATAGWLWKHPPRVSSVANLFPVMTSCFIALGAIAMNSGLRSLSASEMSRIIHNSQLIRSSAFDYNDVVVRRSGPAR
jgi:hypothetical protein